MDAGSLQVLLYPYYCRFEFSFIFKKLQFLSLQFNSKLLFCSCINESFEMVTNLANSATTFLFNYTFYNFMAKMELLVLRLFWIFNISLQSFILVIQMGLLPSLVLNMEKDIKGSYKVFLKIVYYFY